jgi:hypothetical protein
VGLLMGKSIYNKKGHRRARSIVEHHRPPLAKVHFRGRVSQGDSWPMIKSRLAACPLLCTSFPPAALMCVITWLRLSFLFAKDGERVLTCNAAAQGFSSALIFQGLKRPALQGIVHPSHTSPALKGTLLHAPEALTMPPCECS